LTADYTSANLRIFNALENARRDAYTYSLKSEELFMATVVVELSPQDEKALKARTGERSAGAALKAWITRANPERTTAQLRAALRASRKEEAKGKGRRFTSGREAIQWLEN